MATQKRATNGNGHAFDARLVLGQAEQMTASANIIAQAATEVSDGAA